MWSVNRNIIPIDLSKKSTTICIFYRETKFIFHVRKNVGYYDIKTHRHYKLSSNILINLFIGFMDRKIL